MQGEMTIRHLHGILLVMILITDRAGRFSLLKTSSLLLLAAPAAWLLWRALTHDLGPLAMTEALHVTGQWAVRFLIATLALTPLQRLFRCNRLALVRRMFGVGTFLWAALHFTLYVASLKYDAALVMSEIARRHYLTIGFLALLGLALLAATSTDHMLKSLGSWWKRIHSLVYAIAAIALLHFFMQAKIDTSEAALMTGIFLTLLLYRLVLRLRVPPGPVLLACAAIGGAVATALVESAWYGLATGIDPWRVLAANLHPGLGPRPATLVLLGALIVGAACEVRRHLMSSAGARTRDQILAAPRAS